MLFSASQVVSAATLALVGHTSWVSAAALPAIASAGSLYKQTKQTNWTSVDKCCWVANCTFGWICIGYLGMLNVEYVECRGKKMESCFGHSTEAIFSYTSVAESSGTKLCCKPVFVFGLAWNMLQHAHLAWLWIEDDLLTTVRWKSVLQDWLDGKWFCCSFQQYSRVCFLPFSGSLSRGHSGFRIVYKLFIKQF